MSMFQQLKIQIIAATGLSNDALHIYVGLAALFAVALAFRSTVRSIVPWTVVLIGAVVLELPDLNNNLKTTGQWQLGGSVHDVVNTMFWPTALLFLARSRTLFGFDR